MRKLMSIVFCLVFSGTALAAGQNKETKRLESAAYVVNEIMQTPENGIPRDLLGRAICVGVIPSELRLRSVLAVPLGVARWYAGRAVTVPGERPQCSPCMERISDSKSAARQQTWSSL